LRFLVHGHVGKPRCSLSGGTVQSLEPSSCGCSP
jgi:hypothetical protein